MRDRRDLGANVAGVECQLPEKHRLATRHPQFHEFGLLVGNFERGVELADRVAAAPEVRSDWILDGGVCCVKGQDIVGAALSYELEVTIDCLRDGVFGWHGFGRYRGVLSADASSAAVVTGRSHTGPRQT